MQDFPDWEANPLVWSENLLFGKIFVENCIKMKEIGPRGGASLAPPRGSVNVLESQLTIEH